MLRTAREKKRRGEEENKEEEGGEHVQVHEKGESEREEKKN